MLKMAHNQTDKVFIVGLDASKVPGVLLLAGQVVTVTPADGTVIITPDPSPLPTDADYKLADGTPIPKGTPTQFSGTVSFDTSAVANVPVNVTASIKNTDGSPVNDPNGVAIPDIVDSVELVPGLLAAEGELFGTPA